jgi:hypothetical protein
MLRDCAALQLSRVLLLLSVCWPSFSLLRAADRTHDCALSFRAAQLVAALDRATTKMLNSNGEFDPAPKGGAHGDWRPHCSQFLRAVMRDMRSSDLAIRDSWTDESADANTLISRMHSSPDWLAVNGAETAQELANSGALIVGTYPGHVGIVFPLPPHLDVSAFRGKGPFIRDGNEHVPDANVYKRLFPSSWGAVRTSIAFGPVDQVKWYSFRAAMPSLWDTITAKISSWTGRTDQSCKEIDGDEICPVRKCLDQCGDLYQNPSRPKDMNALRWSSCIFACRRRYNYCDSLW